jgi:Leucine-rich repeat (LRR) protein
MGASQSAIPDASDDPTGEKAAAAAAEAVKRATGRGQQSGWNCFKKKQESKFALAGMSAKGLGSTSGKVAPEEAIVGPTGVAKLFQAGQSAVDRAVQMAKTRLDLSQEEAREGLVFPILTTVPDKIFNMRRIEVLSLRRNALTVIPEDIQFLPELRELDVSENKLSLLPESLYKCSKLQQLFASENKLVGLPITLGELEELWRLILFKNELTLLPEELGNCTKLREVNVYSNKILRIPASFGTNLKELQIFNCGANRLKALPNCPGWVRMVHLTANWNNMVITPSFSATADCLGQIQLNDNKLTEWPILGKAAHVQLVDLAKNDLTAVPDSISHLEALTTLQLRWNKIVTLPDAAFTRLTQLEVLDLERNNVEVIPPSLGSCMNLRVLILSGNKITTLPIQLMSCTQLEKVALDRNPLLDIAGHPPTMRVIRHFRRITIANGNAGSTGTGTGAGELLVDEEVAKVLAMD